MSTLIHHGDETARQHNTFPEDRPLLPPGFPDYTKGSMVWDSSDFETEKEYVVQLSTQDVGDVETGLEHFEALGLPSTALCRKTFPLSDDLSLRLRAVSEAIHNGRGFSVVRGIDPSRYDDTANARIFAGVASHIGDERSDLRHIADASQEKNKDGATLRPPDLAVKMGFHTDVDSGDILALYMQNVSNTGGKQSLVSFWKVYNDLVAENPLVLGMLAKNWRYQVPWSNGRTEVIDRPLIHHYGGRMMINYAKSFVLGSKYDTRLPGGAPISPAQHQAIAVLEDMCHRNALQLTQERGDMLFVNNLSILHAREQFQDDRSQDQSRHVINVMLRDGEKAWSQPQEVSRYARAQFKQPWAGEILVRGEMGIRKRNGNGGDEGNAMKHD